MSAVCVLTASSPSMDPTGFWKVSVIRPTKPSNDLIKCMYILCTLDFVCWKQLFNQAAKVRVITCVFKPAGVTSCRENAVKSIKDISNWWRTNVRFGERSTSLLDADSSRFGAFCGSSGSPSTRELSLCAVLACVVMWICYVDRSFSSPYTFLTHVIGLQVTDWIRAE